MNKQPYYHRAVVLFTATREISADEFEEAIQSLELRGLVADSMQCVELDADPADLME